MGGNALGHFVRRHLAAEYHPKAYEVSKILNGVFPARLLSAVKAYDTKESFGDLDIVMLSDDLPPNWIDRVLQAFGSKHHQKNGNVLSAEFNGLQVDIITHSLDEYQFARRYYAYNDLGNLMGRTAYGMGLKLAHNGLFYRHKHEQKDSDVFVTNDWSGALKILGFDAQRWYNGFHTLEDIFDFVRAGQYYTTRDFLLENRNHKAKTRDNKRASYMKFLDYIAEKGDVLGEWSVVKWPEWRERLFKQLPLLEQRVAVLEGQYEVQRKIKKAFNGFMVTELTGLKGKSLGEFMAHVKAEHDFPVRALHDSETSFRQYVWELYLGWADLGDLL